MYEASKTCPVSDHLTIYENIRIVCSQTNRQAREAMCKVKANRKFHVMGKRKTPQDNQVTLLFMSSIFSSAWLCQQSSWYGIFVRRPCRNYPRTYWADSSQISAVASPGPYPHTFFVCLFVCFLHFWKKKCIFKIFRNFFFVFVNMGPDGSQNAKCYSSLKSILLLFKLFLNFLLSGPHKSTVFYF